MWEDQAIEERKLLFRTHESLCPQKPGESHASLVANALSPKTKHGARNTSSAGLGPRLRFIIPHVIIRKFLKVDF